MKDEIKNKLIEIGYTGDFTLSNIIDWIRINKKFNIWIEHGHSKNHIATHDVTTKFGCHRGSYKKYEDAQMKGIEIFIEFGLDE